MHKIIRLYFVKNTPFFLFFAKNIRVFACLCNVLVISM